MTGDTLQTIDKFYAKTQGLATAKAPEFMPIVRMLSHGTHSGDADRAKLHELADDLSIEKVRALIALATANTRTASREKRKIINVTATQATDAV